MKDPRIIGILAALAWAVLMAWRAGEHLIVPLAVLALPLLTLSIILSPAQAREAWLGTPVLKSALRGVVAGLILSAISLALVRIFVPYLPFMARELQGLYSQLRLAPPPAQTWPLLLLIIAAEEQLFRGPLLSRTGIPASRALALSTTLYVLANLSSASITLTLLSLTLGLLWGWQRQRSGGLVEPFMTHLIWDVVVMILCPADRLWPELF